MEFIIHGKEQIGGTYRRYSMDNPEFRKSYNETMERVAKMDPRKLAPERRLMIKAMRFQGKLPKLVAHSAAIRAAMTKEINS
jgi:hypothetical protein